VTELAKVHRGASCGVAVVDPDERRRGISRLVDGYNRHAARERGLDPRIVSRRRVHDEAVDGGRSY
jgi:hypothetical protein